MKSCNGYCVVMLSLALCGCGAAPSGTPAADGTVALATYSGSRSATTTNDGETASLAIYINGVPLNEIAANAALLGIDLAGADGAPSPHPDAASRPPLGHNTAVMAKALSFPPAFTNATSAPKGMPAPAL
ncbi:hypothetical protein FO488_05295 [Geobacter sp. FeAm09]|uniref:hypothetical protein n=1 Tax=Geobacter sp. FeAm09 TaxID=2597769 RepID=UPI0011EDC5F9|nr:hypothetical protein [Geobacter sp. FeAm09]QEM67624.1 hypothetical protein FO488_05295 [Geobacter sp. FeAm09]